MRRHATSPWRPMLSSSGGNQLLADAQQRVETARRVVDELSSRDETQRVAARLAKIDAALRDRDGIAHELSIIAVTDHLLAQIEKAAAAVERAEGQLALVSATVEFVAATDIELVIGDQRISLAAGETWSTLANAATEVEVPGILTARVTRGCPRWRSRRNMMRRNRIWLLAWLRHRSPTWPRREVPISGAAYCRAPATSSPRPWPGCAATTMSSNCALVWRNTLPARVFRRHHDRLGHCPHRTRRGRSGPRHIGRRLRDPPTRRGAGDEQADRGIHAGNTSAGPTGHSARRARGGR